MGLLQRVFGRKLAQSMLKDLPNDQRIRVDVDESDPNELKVQVRQEKWQADSGWVTQKQVTLSAEDGLALACELEQSRSTNQPPDLAQTKPLDFSEQKRKTGLYQTAQTEHLKFKTTKPE